MLQAPPAPVIAEEDAARFAQVGADHHRVAGLAGREGRGGQQQQGEQCPHWGAFVSRTTRTAQPWSAGFSPLA